MTCRCNCSHGHGAISPIEALKDEHRVIERVLDAAERVLTEPDIDQAFVEKFVDFVRNFADGCHHAKEEDQLFPMLEQAGVPREDGPIGCMLSEHEAGRKYVRDILGDLAAAAAGDATAGRIVRSAIAAYIDLLREHISKEDNVLFEMAERLLGDFEQKELTRAFECVEEGQGDRHQKYLSVAEELQQRAFGKTHEPARS